MGLILDLIEPIELSDEAKEKFINERNALQTLHSGLDWLYNSVRATEKLVAERLPEGQTGFHFGRGGILEGINQNLVVCSFHWYAVSACNLVRLIGWLYRATCDSAPRPIEYATKVLPSVLPWRNKVAAHFAQTLDDPRDSHAEQQVSPMNPLVFASSKRFVVSEFVLRITKGEDTTDSSGIGRWSLTEVHEQLAQRYWPPSDSSVAR